MQIQGTVIVRATVREVDEEHPEGWDRPYGKMRIGIALLDDETPEEAAARGVVQFHGEGAKVSEFIGFEPAED